MKLGSLPVLFLLIPGLAPLAAQVVQYDITEVAGAEIPSKLTFLTRDGKAPEKLDIKSRVPEFAARKNVVYQLYGKGEIPVPAGSYRVYVSRGLEWSIQVRDLQVAPGRPAVLKATLERVVDTRGYLSGDLHLHTKTFSGHGDANVEERLITLCAEGLEWAVATDHNTLTDYRPYARRLGADRWMTTTVGNEVTSSVIGHFNTFPLDPRGTPVNHRIVDPRELFRKMRANPLHPLIQLNHPRWVGLHGAYFRELDLSPVTGEAENPLFSWNFDSFEVVNDNALGGWEFRLGPTGAEPDFDHSVREDWFNLLNRGFTFTGVGNSDSHHVEESIGGCPRNFILASTDDPARAVESELVEAVRARRVSVSSGIFVTMTAVSADGRYPVGSTVRSGGREVALEITVQAAPWIDADRLVVIGNGEPVFTAELQGSDPSVAESTAGRPVVRFKDTVRVRPVADTWYVAYAIGDEAPYPMLHRVTFPLGFTNPIWVDADSNGKLVSLRDQATLAVRPPAGRKRLQPGEVTARLSEAGPVFRRQAVVALGERARENLAPLTELLLDSDRGVRLAAATTLSGCDDRRALAALLAGRDSAADAVERLVFDRELVKAGDSSALEELSEAYQKSQGLERFRLERDFKEFCRQNRIRRWWVAGPFPVTNIEQGLATRFPPEGETFYNRRYGVGGRVPASWRRASTDSSHFLNFRRAFMTRGGFGGGGFGGGGGFRGRGSSSDRPAGGGPPADRPQAAYAHVTVEARKPVQTVILVKAVCGLEVRVGQRTIYRQLAKEKAPYYQVVPAFFRAGPNSLLVKGVYEKGEWGFNLMVVDPASDLTFIVPDALGRPSQSY